ncbi:aldehyde dehydrogenase family protein [uncultured Corynebacterium sp.]|uniref:aldehyde dehydrogenase family protein n=1 Tax=uncultured Corynebacterium sp. TaxID=159447 RepID=UPI0025ED7B53|nr:aldehyde dehydrogenase family protein [uncultured Corynebacterium sp.]
MNTDNNVTEIPKAELQRLLDAQRRAQAADPVPDADTRRNRVDRLVAAVLEHATELAEAMDADFGGRPATTSLELDILSGLASIAVTREQIEEQMRPTELPAGLDGALPAFIQHRPKGVVGVIGPWNFPVLLVVVPAAEAFAAGNRVMVKFSDFTPRTGEVFARAVASRFSPEEMVVVTGGSRTAADFGDLRFDHLFFTGSPKVGRLVAAAAGANLVPVTLELGGKNPAVVAPDADVADAARRIAAGRMINNGQVCLCPDYAFVPADRRDEFIDAYTAAVADHFPTFVDNPDVVSIVNDRNMERVTGLIDDAVARGATACVIVPDSERDRLADAAGRRRLAPTLLTGVPGDALINGEEIFGPVLVLHTYDDVDEAIARVNANEHPLQSYWYGGDTADFRRFLTVTTSGGVSRNDTALAYLNDAAPFGGIGMSGSGAYHGQAGFDTFSHRRTVVQSDLPDIVAASLVAPLPPARVTAVAEAVAGAAAHATAAVDG